MFHDVPGFSEMFRHVPACFRMLRVPGFIDARDNGDNSNNISLLKIRPRQTSVTASGSEITARKTSGCRRCEVSRRSGLVCDVKKAILPSRVKRE